MGNKWKEIWNRKSVDIAGLDSELEKFRELKRADGFDVAVEDADTYYRVFYNDWIAFYNRLMELSSVPVRSVYEVGCGSGVNLFMFRNRGIETLGGIDYSKNLADNARKLVGSDDITNDDAVNISDEPRYDFVMSESVFQYFLDYEYAEKVLRHMLAKSRGIVYLGEIHDAAYEDELMEYRRRTIENYDEKYDGLSKRFYSKEWIKRIADGRNVIFTEVNNPAYINGKYLFNCFILPE